MSVGRGRAEERGGEGRGTGKGRGGVQRRGRAEERGREESGGAEGQDPWSHSYITHMYAQNYCNSSNIRTYP